MTVIGDVLYCDCTDECMASIALVPSPNEARHTGPPARYLDAIERGWKVKRGGVGYAPGHEVEGGGVE